MGRLKNSPRWGGDPEGATSFDAEGLKLPGTISIRQLHIAEARNISAAFTKYLASVPSKRKAPFTIEWSYALHREMFCDVWEWAGQRRNSGLNIGFQVYEIDPGLKNLFDDLATWLACGSYSIIEQACRLHHRAVQIHPFRNGNGRWARLLANIWLKRHKSALVNWPEESIMGDGALRQEYLDAVKAADHGDFQRLLSLHRKYS